MRVMPDAVFPSTDARPLPPLTVGRKVCQDHARSSRLEWLETNGAGGFAMGTVAGTNTRRYHGLLGERYRDAYRRITGTELE